MKLKNKNSIKIICFDVDNVICHTKGKDYKNAKPNKMGIKKINMLFEKGYIIKLYTAKTKGQNFNSSVYCNKLSFKYSLHKYLSAFFKQGWLHESQPTRSLLEIIIQKILM